MDAEMLTGAVIAVVSFLPGILVGSLAASARMRRRTPKQPNPICACAHSKGEHADGSGDCHAQIKHTMNGVHMMRRCTCTRYFGPEPLIDLYATPRYLPEDAS